MINTKFANQLVLFTNGGMNLFVHSYVTLPSLCGVVLGHS